MSISATGVQRAVVVKRLYAYIKDFSDVSLILFGPLGHLALAYINN